MKYKNQFQSKTGEEQMMYQEVYGSQKNVKGEFILFVIQEEIKPLRQVILELKTETLVIQKQKINQIVLALTKGAINIDDKIGFYLDVNLDNVFIRFNKDGNMLAVFSFKHHQTASRKDVSEGKATLIKYKNTCAINIIKQVYDYMVEINLAMI